MMELAAARGRAHARVRDHRAAPRPQARRPVGHRRPDGRADPRRGRQRARADPLRAPAGPRGAPGGHLRRPGPDAHDPARLDRPRSRSCPACCWRCGRSARSSARRRSGSSTCCSGRGPRGSSHRAAPRRSAGARPRGGRGAAARHAGPGPARRRGSRCGLAPRACTPPTWTARSPRSARSLITWLNRGTLHLVRSEDLPADPRRHDAAASHEQATAAWPQEGVPPDDAERGVAAIERALADEGPLSVGRAARARRRRLACARKGQALYHLLLRASLDGLVVRGPMVGGKHAYVLVRDWLGEPEPRGPRRGAPRVRPPLSGRARPGDRSRHGSLGRHPAARRARGLQAIAGELATRGRARGPEGARARAELPPPKLLGAFEPVLLGWISREDIFGDGPKSFVTDAGCSTRSRSSVGARWRAGSWWTGSVELEPFRRLAKADRAALERRRRTSSGSWA